IIVVGDGTIGLAVAHTVHPAGIEFFIPERGITVVEDKGITIIPHSHTLRFSHRFIVARFLQKALGTSKFARGRSRVYISSSLYYLCCFSSLAFLPRSATAAARCLLSAARENILMREEVFDIKMHLDKVELFQGSIVIGTDGVNSKTRQLKRTVALETHLSQPWDPKQLYISSCQLLIGCFPSPSLLGFGHDIQSKDTATMYFSGPDRGWFFLYNRLPEPGKRRTNYTDHDVESEEQEFMKFPLIGIVKVKDVWR
ncbi:unnamed protein product, partial [Clonostachys rosea]